MAEQSFKYIIVGGGLAGASAVEGIRERDREGEVLLVGMEKDLPYHRPPLTKGLWTGKKEVQDIFVHEAKWYADQGVEVRAGREVIKIQADHRTVLDTRGNLYHYEKLLLATGGRPKRLEIPGGNTRGIRYFRTVGDYLAVRQEAGAGQSAVVIGGGFIGSEIAAALTMNQVQVTMVFPGKWIGGRIFPQSLGEAVTEEYRKRGVRIMSGETPASIRRREGRFETKTEKGQTFLSDILVAGIGILPETELAGKAGVKIGNGILVNEYLQSSDANIYAAGDNAFFPEAVIGPTRVEHWDNAVKQGKQAGRNMAGAGERYDHLPYFFSDLFDLGYEAVGEVDGRLETVADWQEENRKGVVYYMRDGKVRGAMLCNVWEKTDAARELIRAGKKVSQEELRGGIR
jgi:3-phenylpropionate/trans-cinnamate dioxygenase ferredoxin reductase component